jgi:effector-binding domain-containing protein
MKSFRNNSAAFLLLASFLISLSFVERSKPAFGPYNYTTTPEDTTRQPKMTVEEVTLEPMMVLAIRDTAVSMDQIGPVLGKNYGQIGAFMGQNGLEMARQPMAWYYTDQAPFILEAGIPVNKKPAGVSGRITLKEIPASKAVVVHFWGPYEMTGQAYEKIREWLKKNNKKAMGAPFDIYISDPMTVKDPYEVQTDVVQVYQ